MVSKLPYLALAAGAAASIATSLPTWEVSATIAVPAVALPSGQTRKLHVHAEVTLPQKVSSAELGLILTLDLHPQAPASDQVVFTLSPLDHVDPRDLGDEAAIDPSKTSQAILGDFSGACPWPTCVRDFELVIGRTTGAVAPQIDIDGTAELTARGDASDVNRDKLERESVVVLTVEPLP